MSTEGASTGITGLLTWEQSQIWKTAQQVDRRQRLRSKKGANEKMDRGKKGRP